jgi:hypothetical protein
MSPKVALIIQWELQKLFEGQIMIVIKDSNWVANVVLVRRRMERFGYVLISGTSTWHLSKITILFLA